MNIQSIGLEILGTRVHALNIVPLVGKLCFLSDCLFYLATSFCYKTLLVSRVIDSDTILLILF